jgi:hypothetical protein
MDEVDVWGWRELLGDAELPGFPVGPGLDDAVFCDVGFGVL